MIAANNPLTDCDLSPTKLISGWRSYLLTLKTILPATIVMTTCVLARSAGAAEKMSCDKTARSASFPSSSVPNRSSENLAYAGGMGEVYRARDTRLDRTVAIKILPQQVSSDPGRRARFEREARTISALSHPNICALFDIGEQGGIYYVVLEYLEGKTLADRLVKGPMPISEVLKIGSDIALALETAHRNGIVHRDLKPANVMLSKSG